MKSYPNYEELRKQEELDLFLLHMRKYITNKLIYFSRLLNIYYDYNDLSLSAPKTNFRQDFRQFLTGFSK